MINFKACFSFLIFISVFKQTSAQPPEQIVKVIVAPNHPDWLYKVGEKVSFSVSVLQFGNPVKTAKVRYEVGPEKMDPVKKDSMTLTNGTFKIDGGTMKTAGFLRCTVYAEVDGKVYRGLATGGFEPEVIAPTVAN